MELNDRPFDQAHPLWDIWLLTGALDGRVPMLIRFHHVLADGIAALALLGTLFDAAPLDSAPNAWASLRSPHYTLGEKIRLWYGKFSSGVSALRDEILATDLADRVAELSLPAYFFHGAYDYTVNYQLAKNYVGRLKAPLKGFYTFGAVRSQPHTGRISKGAENHARGCARRSE